MLSKIVIGDGRGGLVERYVDHGPGRAERCHGRPAMNVAAPVGGKSNMQLVDGARQVPSLGRAA